MKQLSQDCDANTKGHSSVQKINQYNIAFIYEHSVLSFSKQSDTSLQRAGFNFHTTISKQISI